MLVDLKNSNGFAGLPGGSRGYSGQFTDNGGDSGEWWSSSESLPMFAWYHRIQSYDKGIVKRYEGSKADGFSVRCIKD